MHPGAVKHAVGAVFVAGAGAAKHGHGIGGDEKLARLKRFKSKIFAESLEAGRGTVDACSIAAPRGFGGIVIRCSLNGRLQIVENCLNVAAPEGVVERADESRVICHFASFPVVTAPVLRDADCYDGRCEMDWRG